MREPAELSVGAALLGGKLRDPSAREVRPEGVRRYQMKFSITCATSSAGTALTVNCQ
jgi:hypothetical protein